MEQETNSVNNTIAITEQRRNSLIETVEFRPSCPLKVFENHTDNLLQNTGAKVNQAERKRHSEPIPERSSSDSDERKNPFERRRLWTASKQESFDLPEEWKGQTEDNVFTDVHRSRRDQKGRLMYQRSLSVPASLPDVIPEHNHSFERDSPDVLFNSNKGSQKPVTTATDLSSSNTEEMLEEQEKKKIFEGSVCYDPVTSDSPREGKRKKSVTFERPEGREIIVSERGKQARSHFRSSGYGSQSDNSQFSQSSNLSSEHGSVMSDDVLETDKSSFEIDDKPCMDYYSMSSTKIDGSIEDTGEEAGDKQHVEASQASDDVQDTASLSPSEVPAPQPNSGQTPEEQLDETEIWRREMKPTFHDSNTDPADIPNLSIFSKFESLIESSEGSVYIPCIAFDDFSNLRNHILEQNGGGHSVETERSDIPIPSQLPQGHSGASGEGVGSRLMNAEASENKTSPTTREECQRELLKRLFEEKMQQYDPSKETIVELFEWVKNNIADALTPSPKSPFFPGGSPQSQTFTGFRVPEGVSNVLLAGSREPNRLTPPANFFPQRTAVAGAEHPMLPLQHFPEEFLAHYKQNGQRGPLAPLSAPAQNFQRGPEASCVPPHSQYVQNLQRASVPSHVPSHNVHQSQTNPNRGTWNQQMFPPPTAYRPPQPMPAVPHTENYHRNSATLLAQQKHVAAPVQPQPSNTRPSPLTVCQPGLPTVLDEARSLSMYSSESVEFSNGLSTNVKDSHLEQLVNVAQCNHRRCDNPTCMQSKRRIYSLKESLKRGPSDLNADNMQMLKLLHEHYASCDLPNCGVPWCHYMTLWCQGGEKKPQDLVTLLSNPLHTLLPSELRFSEFTKLDSDLQLESEQRELYEWKDWLMVCPLSQSFTAARVVPLAYSPPCRHWVVKMTYLHEGGNQLKVLEKLRDLRHPGIVKHIWMAIAESDDLLVVCTDFLPGISVRELLDQKGIFAMRQMHHYLQQILSAVEHLHSLHVIYLNWTCSNLLLDESCRNVKLSNLTTSVDQSSGNADVGTVKLTLPPDVVPPELLVRGGELTLKSDSWGVACVLHEMLTGVRPWYDLRHNKQEEIWEQIKLIRLDQVLSRDLPQGTTDMMAACFQKAPDTRLSVRDMMERISAEYI